jgi:hypothetical protein
MTTLHENEDQGLLDDRMIDRLVDGALPDAERRKVLARLDVEPDGWRRCALAFLEAQSWREALDPLVIRESAVPLVPVQAELRMGGPGRLRSLAAIAAGLIVAFALGWSVRSVPPATAPERSRAEVGNQVMAPAPSTPVSADVAVKPRSEPTTTPVPTDAPLAEPVVKAWERRGYQVQRSQRLVSLELENGRRVAVPIDEVRVRFVGDRTY